jgi:hypothetical protein
MTSPSLLYEESSRVARNRRRHRRFPHRFRALPPPNSPPCALLRLGRLYRRAPGEHPKFSPSSRTPAWRRRAALAGELCVPAGMAMACLAPWPMWPLRWLRAPLSATLARVALSVKRFHVFSVIPGKWQQIFKTCKMHSKFPAYQKNMYDISKCSVK